MDHLEFLYIAAFITVITAVSSFLFGWWANNIFDAWFQVAQYSKTVMHPEMYDEEGKILHERLTYLTFEDEAGIMEDEDD